jgi:glycogen operon protein
MPDFAFRLTGSSDLYADDGRRPLASINFVTCHDGFSLHDLVSYNTKHNDANGEANRDGTDDNRSWNCGYEGDTDDLEVVALREKQKRNMLATVLVSQGVPMLSHGDEIGRTQHGNNNVYCQDNELSWIDWAGARENWTLMEFVQRLIRLRAEHPVFRQRRFFHGKPIRDTPAGGQANDSNMADIAWLTPGGEEMSDSDWNAGFAKSLAVFLNGDAIAEPDRRGEPVRDDSFLLLFNAHDGNMPFTMPPARYGAVWRKEIDTAAPVPTAEDERSAAKAGEIVQVDARSTQVLRRV